MKKTELRNPNNALLRRVQRRIDNNKIIEEPIKDKNIKGIRNKIQKESFNFLHDVDKDFGFVDKDFGFVEKKTRLGFYSRRGKR